MCFEKELKLNQPKRNRRRLITPFPCVLVLTGAFIFFAGVSMGLWCGFVLVTVLVMQHLHRAEAFSAPHPPHQEGCWRCTKKGTQLE